MIFIYKVNIIYKHLFSQNKYLLNTRFFRSMSSYSPERVEGSLGNEYFRKYTVFKIYAFIYTLLYYDASDQVLAGKGA